MEKYILELTEKELIYLKLLLGKQTGKADTELIQNANAALSKFDTEFIQSILFFQQFTEEERKEISYLASTFDYKYDNVDLYKKVSELSKQINT